MDQPIRSKKGKVALVTGAASALGFAPAPCCRGRDRHRGRSRRGGDLTETLKDSGAAENFLHG